MFRREQYWFVGCAALVAALYFVNATNERSGVVRSSNVAAFQSASQPASNASGTNRNGHAVTASNHPVDSRASLLLKNPVDWKKMSRGLGASLAEANDSSNGQLAYVVAQALERCITISSEMDAYRENAGRVNDADVQRALADQFAEKQRIYSQCQTVQGDAKSKQVQMLDLALAQGVVGAASNLLVLGQDSSRIRTAVLADAKNGELISMALVASGEPEKYLIDAASQRLFQAALVSAANSAELREAAGSALVLAQKWAADQRAADNPSEANVALARQVWAGQSDGLQFNSPGSAAGSADAQALVTPLIHAIKRRYQGG